MACSLGSQVLECYHFWQTCMCRFMLRRFTIEFSNRQGLGQNLFENTAFLNLFCDIRVIKDREMQLITEDWIKENSLELNTYLFQEMVTNEITK